MEESIKVAVRVRPFLPGESAVDCVAASKNQVVVGDGRCFAFDTVFGMRDTSDNIYVALGQPLANSFLDGFNVSTIAYGQTGAGKTFTMSALTSDVVQEIFCRLREDAARAAERDEADLGFNLRLSVLEVYNEHIGDLLASKHSSPTSSVAVNNSSWAGSSQTGASPLTAASPLTDGSGGLQRKVSSASGAFIPQQALAGMTLQLREDPKGGVYVPGLTEIEVRTEEELLNCVDKATANRKTASTLMNASSSRSHCVVTLTLRHRGATARCCFVDLAGSERFKKSLGVGVEGTPRIFSGTKTGNVFGVDGGLDGHNVVMARMREGISINGGLLALGNVIVALCEKKAHVPYRSSKLTRLLQPMLGGNSRTAMVACISPVASSIEETLNTLKYADRAKSIKTSPQLIVSTFDSMHEAERTILALRKELEEVQHQLAQALNSSVAAPVGGLPPRAGSPDKENHSRRASTATRSRSRSRQKTGTGIRKTRPGADGAASAHRDPSRSRSGVSVPPPAPALPAGKTSAATSPAASEAASAALLQQVHELTLQLSHEKTLTKRLEEDLFQAEYTTMVEVEKRKATEERVHELEEGSVPAVTPTTPNTQLSTNMEKLKQLEEERDSLEALKVRRQHEQLRLREALDKGEASASGSDSAGAANTSGAGEELGIFSEASLAELSSDIDSKKNQISALQRQNDDAVHQLHQYEQELAAVGHEKAKLQLELRRAEQLLEKSEMAWQQKEAERARLYSEYKERVRQAEEKATDYRKRVRQAEHEVKARALSIARMTALQGEVEKLREEAARARAGRRAEHQRGAQKSAAHAQELSVLQRQLKEAESQINRLQGDLQNKNAEIVRVRAHVNGNARQQQQQAVASLTPGPITSGRRGSNDATAASSAYASGNGEVQAQIDAELASLEKLEREQQELQDYREVLAEAQTTDAPKYHSALKGFTKRLHRIDAELSAPAASDMAPEAKAKLTAERADIEVKLQQLASFQRMFDEAKLQLGEFDNRIDSLNETRKYHLHRVRRLQRTRAGSAGRASADTSISVSATTVQSSSRGRPDGVTGPLALPSTLSASYTGSVLPPPSVREITDSRARIRRPPRSGASGTVVRSNGTVAEDRRESPVGQTASAREIQQRYVQELEQTLEKLQKESNGLRAELTELKAAKGA